MILTGLAYFLFQHKFFFSAEQPDEDKSDDSSLGFYDSDADKEFFPGDESTSDSSSDERSPTNNMRNRRCNNNQVREQNVQTAILSASDDTPGDNNPPPTTEEVTVDENRASNKRKVKNKTKIIQPGRKRVRHEESWLSNVRKQKHSKGEAYTNKKGKEIPAKNLKQPCTCKMKCFEKLSEENRQQIFKSYWCEQSTSHVKRQFIISSVHRQPIERDRKKILNSGKGKEHTLSYYFNADGTNRMKVCKVMFLNTLCISNKVVINAFKNLQPGGIVKHDQRGKHAPSNKTSNAAIDTVVNHITSIPHYECHYSREKTTRKYLGTHLSIEKMYELYLEFCKLNSIPEEHIAKNWVYRDVFNKRFNLSFKPPEVDTCDTCDSFKAKLKGNLSQLEREAIQDEHKKHIDESKKRYDLKAADSKIGKEDPTHKVLTGDLQKCLATPLITSGLSFYKRKLWTLDFTIHDARDSTVHCLMWDETKGARGGNEIASAIMKWADNVIPDSVVEQITLWTDNCYGQNKNKSLIMCFFWMMMKYPQIKTINQKFLLKGHTHMEADTVHALIERKRKKANSMSILTPWDWQQLVRQTSSKYSVINMELEDFKNFEALLKGKESPFVSRKLDCDKKCVLMSQFVHIQVRRENLGHLFFKTSFDDDFSQVSYVRNRRGQELVMPETLQLVSNQRLPINIAKYNDLMALLPLLPSVCHDYFKNLPRSNNTAMYPDDDSADESD